MKTLKNFIATFVAGILSFPFIAAAQNQGTYIDNLGVQDSSYMEMDFLAEGAQSSSSGNSTLIIIIVAVVVVAAVLFFLLKKKKK